MTLPLQVISGVPFFDLWILVAVVVAVVVWICAAL